jgi:hypothetical protein
MKRLSLFAIILLGLMLSSNGLATQRIVVAEMFTNGG